MWYVRLSDQLDVLPAKPRVLPRSRRLQDHHKAGRGAHRDGEARRGMGKEECTQKEEGDGAHSQGQREEEAPLRKDSSLPQPEPCVHCLMMAIQLCDGSTARFNCK